VTKEVERKSIYSLLSKPITRSQFVVGKYLGLSLTLVVNLAMMAAALYAVLAYYDWTASEGLRASWETPALDPQMLKAFALIGVELLLITATALFFSTFSSAFLSVALTFGVYVIGHFSEDLKRLDSIVESPVLASIGRAVYYVMPNLASLDVKSDVVHGQSVAALQMLSATASNGLFIAVFVLGATIVFSRRDLK
jgi:ABC-type transport system involved in multi-copper enzyme maturation permease subunit